MVVYCQGTSGIIISLINASMLVVFFYSIIVVAVIKDRQRINLLAKKTKLLLMILTFIVAGSVANVLVSS
jgi:hypothetical protein